MNATPAAPSSRPHRAAQVEDAANRAVAHWLRRRGWVVRVEPYTGYGSPGWVRVMARTLLARPVRRLDRRPSPASGAGSAAVAGDAATTRAAPAQAAPTHAPELEPSALRPPGPQGSVPEQSGAERSSAARGPEAGGSGASGASAAEFSPKRREPERLMRGWRRFATAQVAGAVVEVRVGDTVHRLTADRGGYVDAVLPADLAPGWHEVLMSVEGGAPVSAPVLVVSEETTFGMVSDIDDTVMVTMLPRPMVAAWNSLVLHEHARRTVPGMAALYRELLREHPDAPVFYLSTGAWNVASTLRRFLSRHGYPAGVLLLTDWGPTNSGWFRSGQQHKRESLRRLMRELPQVRWLLVGDDGQHDPGLYQEAAAEHPGRVRAIALRQLSPAQQVLSHGLPVPNEETRGTASGAQRTPVVSAPDGAGLAEQLRRLDLC
ncbi:App1 family protein [Allostreptomyces psammosilenae]|uniref:Phosphatidate phosphatase APP1 n=1 Tax=Allostreptomyces psammosilenae TaxID=1892865 RepID=A0A853A3J1_9ACTN|nr:phosphatase domain-containing protein [Allostreptomyces psammosilenae]NYI07444.1 phosphatidate phosphatase APP1 [Allostreptomyces psammosilenae]